MKTFLNQWINYFIYNLFKMYHNISRKNMMIHFKQIINKVVNPLVTIIYSFKKLLWFFFLDKLIHLFISLLIFFLGGRGAQLFSIIIIVYNNIVLFLYE